MRRPKNLRLAPTAVLFVTLFTNAIPNFAAQRARLDLNGQWQFRLDPQNEGEASRWHSTDTPFSKTIQVPGCWQAQGFGERSGIIRNHYVGNAWYRRSLPISADWKEKIVTLRFGGASRRATVFVNGTRVGEHDGFSAPFEFDITRAVRFGAENVVAVRVANPGPAISESPDKQTGSEPAGMFNYIANWGGIHGGVELEATERSWIQDIYVTSDLQRKIIKFKVGIESVEPVDFTAGNLAILLFSGQGSQTLARDFQIRKGETRVELEAPIAALTRDMRLWSPESPYHYTATLVLSRENRECDRVEQRFGI